MIYVTSDLHYGMCNEGDRAVERLAHFLSSASSKDILLLGGDLATDDETLIACLERFKGFRGTKMAIAGNHDVWVGQEGSSWDRYHRLPLLFCHAGFHPLEEEPLTIGDLGFAGTMGWYDYSFADDIGIPLGDYERKACPELGASWGDATHARWNASDREVTEYMVERFEKQLQTLNGIRDLLVLIHHVPAKQLLVHPRCLVPKQWRFLNAFLGSDRFAETLARYPVVRRVINGHIHLPQEARIGQIQYISIGGSYQTKELLTIDGDTITRTLFPS